MPMITPTIAQATPTGNAWRAPSIRLSRSSRSVLMPPCTEKERAISAAITASTG
jgi:hypothetical protein